jgi:secondary thiamine-phosphate synthase enzyme
MNWDQWSIHCKPRSRGFHLITQEILQQSEPIRNYRIGFVQFFIQHTSASLCFNENADPSVRGDFERFFRHTIPDGLSLYQHTLEGEDDITAHLKSALLGSSLQIPIQKGILALGTWQGIYLGEHREQGGSRHILATCFGEKL